MDIKQVTTEDIVMELVVNSGTARSMAMMAIDAALEGNIEDAKKQLVEAKDQIVAAHNFQTSLISQEANGETLPMTLIMVHGQDHLMTSMVVIDLAEKFIQLCEKK